MSEPINDSKKTWIGVNEILNRKNKLSNDNITLSKNGKNISDPT